MRLKKLGHGNGISAQKTLYGPDESTDANGGPKFETNLIYLRERFVEARESAAGPASVIKEILKVYPKMAVRTSVKAIHTSLK